MKKAILLISAFCFMFFACSENNKQQGEIPSSTKKELADGSQNSRKVSAPALAKNVLMESGNVQFASDDMNFEAVGDWSALDSKKFYRNCNEISFGKRANPNLNLDKYCSCLKTIMLDKKYAPTQLNRAVRNEQASVINCLKGSIIKDE